MTVDTYPARHAGPDPVLSELDCDDIVFAFRSSGETMTWVGDGHRVVTALEPVKIRRAVITALVLNGSRHVALLNTVCGRCRAHVADADPGDVILDEPRCQGCLDEESHAAEERRYAEATHRLAGPELVTA